MFYHHLSFGWASATAGLAAGECHSTGLNRQTSKLSLPLCVQISKALRLKQPKAQSSRHCVYLKISSSRTKLQKSSEGHCWGPAKNEMAPGTQRLAKCCGSIPALPRMQLGETQKGVLFQSYSKTPGNYRAVGIDLRDHISICREPRPRKTSLGSWYPTLSNIWWMEESCTTLDS